MLFLTASCKYFSLALRVPALYARSRYSLTNLRCGRGQHCKTSSSLNLNRG
jgi:hypothetical protein